MNASRGRGPLSLEIERKRRLAKLIAVNCCAETPIATSAWPPAS